MISQELLKYLLPSKVYDYFDLIDIKEDSPSSLLIYLDEKSIKPKEHINKILFSKGFDEPVKIQDFPIRDKSVHIIIRRRKWIDKETGKVYSTNWDLTANGTGYTKEFAAFLKELLR